MRKVLISPGYGAGWSTWNDKRLAVDEKVISAFESGMTEDELRDYCIELGYEEPYMGGFDNLKVVFIPDGQIFRVEQYDGNESIEYFDSREWFKS